MSRNSKAVASPEVKRIIYMMKDGDDRRVEDEGCRKAM